MKKTGSEIIVKLLEMEGISVVSGIPGGSILPLYDALAKSSIRHVLARHEQAAGFIAQGMARSTGKPGCLDEGQPHHLDGRCTGNPHETRDRGQGYGHQGSPHGSAERGREQDGLP